MAITQPPQLNTPSQTRATPPSPISALLDFVRTEAGFLANGLRSWPGAALSVIAVILLILAWQMPLDWTVKLGRDAADFLYIQGFNQAEHNKEFAFRWSSDESYLRFPGTGRLPAGTLELKLAVGGRPAKLGSAHVQVYLGNQGPLLGEATVGPGLQTYRFNFTAQPGQYSGDLLFVLREPDAFKTSDHALPLGVVVSEARLTGGAANGRPVLPPPAYLAVLLATLWVFYLSLLRAGWATVGAAATALVPTVGASWAVAYARLQLTPALEVVFLTLVLTYPLLVLGLRTTAFWLKHRATTFPVAEAKWLGLIFVTAFVVKGAGLNHPAFLTIDHWFRVHQILRFVNEPNQFWQQYYHVTTGQTVTGFSGGSAVLGQWGVSVELPYSPLFYLLAAPLAFIWPSHDPNLLAAVNLLATWLEISQIWLLYIIAKRAYRTQWAGWAGVIAAAVFGFYPLSFLLFSDGGYNSILAQWLSLLFVALLVDGLTQPGNYSPTQDAASNQEVWAGLKWSRWRWLGLLVTLTAALLAHTSTLLLLGTLVLAITGLLAVVKSWRKVAWRVGLVALLGLGAAFALYYGFYAVAFLTQSLPTLLQNLQNKGELGQEQKLLGTPLLSGFWPQLWAHFRLFPFGLTLLALAWLWPFSRHWLASKLLNEEERRASVGLYLVWLAWLLVFLLFALIDLKVNLLQKHMLFAAPLLCLGSGLGLSLIWRAVAQWLPSRKLTPRLTQAAHYVLLGLLMALLVFNFWQGVVEWYGRVFYYILPPGSG